MGADQQTQHASLSVVSASATPTVTIHRATPRDLPTVTALFDAYRVFYGMPSNPRAAGDFLSARMQRDESVILVATLRIREREGREHDDIVGFAQLFRTFSSLSLSRVVVLNDLYVAPAARRHGIGRRLVDASREYARQAGALRLELEAQPNNAPAISLYRDMGFVANSQFEHLSLPIGDPPPSGA